MNEWCGFNYMFGKFAQTDASIKRFRRPEPRKGTLNACLITSILDLLVRYIREFLENVNILNSCQSVYYIMVIWEQLIITTFRYISLGKSDP